jgi:hypothetical protein
MVLADALGEVVRHSRCRVGLHIRMEGDGTRISIAFCGTAVKAVVLAQFASFELPRDLMWSKGRRTYPDCATAIHATPPLLPLCSVPSAASYSSHSTLDPCARAVGPFVCRYYPIRRDPLLRIVTSGVERRVEVMREEVGEGEDGSGGEGHGAARRVLLSCSSHSSSSTSEAE